MDQRIICRLVLLLWLMKFLYKTKTMQRILTLKTLLFVLNEGKVTDAMNAS